MIQVELQSKHPHNSFWIELVHKEKEKPVELIKALEKAGWKLTGKLPPLSPEVRDENGRMDFAAMKLLKYKVIKSHYSKQGSGMFGMFTPAEKKNFTKEVKSILKQFGITVTSRELTFQDLI
jgi:Txe/YoeB family toxin of Txe-Axe toxin-antitoxin module